MFPLFAGVNAIEAHHGIAASNAHHDVGVIDGKALITNGLERLKGHRFEIQLVAEVFQRPRVRAVTQRGVRLSVDSVEHNAPCPLQEFIVGFEFGKIDDLPHVETKLFFEHQRNVFSTLGPPVGSEHGVQGDGSVSVR